MANRTQNRNRDTTKATKSWVESSDEFALRIGMKFLDSAYRELDYEGLARTNYQLARWLNENNIKARRGGIWYETTVRRVRKKFKKIAEKKGIIFEDY